jgi:hypothetical protein
MECPWLVDVTIFETFLLSTFGLVMSESALPFSERTFQGWVITQMPGLATSSQSGETYF